MKYVRDTYGVPAKRGRITRATHYLHVGGIPFHPTDGVVYYGDDGEVLMDTREAEK